MNRKGWHHKTEILNSAELTKSRGLSLNYSNFNPFENLVFITNLSYYNNKNSPVLTNYFFNNYIANAYIFSPYEEVYDGMLILDKKFKKSTPFSIKNVVKVNYSNSLNYLNEQASYQKNNFYFYRASLFSHFKNNIFQFEAGFELNKRTIKQTYNNSLAKINQYNSFIDFKGVVKDRLLWNLKFSNLIQESSLGKNTIFMVSPKITMDSKNKKWSYSIYGNNIFNLKDNSKLTSKFTNLSIENNKVAMLDGYILFKTEFNF